MQLTELPEIPQTLPAFQKTKGYHRQQQSTDKPRERRGARLNTRPRPTDVSSSQEHGREQAPLYLSRHQSPLHNHTLDTANPWPWRRRSGSATSFPRRPGLRTPPGRPWQAMSRRPMRHSRPVRTPPRFNLLAPRKCVHATR